MKYKVGEQYISPYGTGFRLQVIAVYIDGSVRFRYWNNSGDTRNTWIITQTAEQMKKYKIRELTKLERALK